MNPALGARCFLLISFASIMTNFNCDAYTGATPLAAVKAGESVNVLDMVIGRTGGTTVSYTHLDVYKRQPLHGIKLHSSCIYVFTIREKGA